MKRGGLLRRSRLSAPAPLGLQPLKLRAIDFAVHRLGLRSLADLGGVWAVEAGYSFYAATRHGLDRMALVDTGITDAVRQRAADLPALDLVDGNFGDPAIAQKVGGVDGVLLFDVLLHQVDPDWDGVLRLWAPHTSAFVIVQPMYTESAATVRLVELGEQEYLRTVPNEENARLLFGRIDDVHPSYGRPWRDVHEVWQWGMVDADVHSTLTELGFRPFLYENDGGWMDLPRFENHAFVYGRVK